MAVMIERDNDCGRKVSLNEIEGRFESHPDGTITYANSLNPGGLKKSNFGEDILY